MTKVKPCCDKLAQEVDRHYLDLQDDGTLSITGCCGHCYVQHDVRFCPWCGQKVELEAPQDSAQ